MRAAGLAAIFVAAFASIAAAQSSGRTRQPPVADRKAEAYAQFLLARHYEDDNPDQAIAAYKRAMELDPESADVPAALAAFYLGQNKIDEALATAGQATKIDPENREANRVLGIIHAALAENSSGSKNRGGGSIDADHLARAIKHLEIAVGDDPTEGDPNVRATLGRAYLQSGSFDKAIALLSGLVSQEPQWQDGPLLLAEAYAGAGRNAEAIAWLNDRTSDDPRLLPTLADFYEREHRWTEAAATYAKAVAHAPHSAELKTRYASALLNAGGRDAAVKARDVLEETVSGGSANGRVLYLLSQAQRRAGDVPGAEKTARKVIAQDAKSPWGYYALAEALEGRHQYQSVVDELTPPITEFRSRAGATAFERGLLLPHLGFAYQELGEYDKAIAAFEEARQASPKDPAVVGYLIEAHLAARRYGTAATLAHTAVQQNPDDLRLVRLEAQALQHSGKAEQAIALLEATAKAHPDDPSSAVALAQLYSDENRGPQAVAVLQDAQTKFPDDGSVAFELGAVYDKMKRFPEAETAFRTLLKQQPENAAAMNYLGYMLAERGERLDESVDLLKRALELEPDNGSYLDSLGWAYFKKDKLDLAADNLKRAADQQKNNSVIQDHYGEVLFKLGRYQDAIAAWNRALNGDGDSIDRGDIDRKIKTARQKIGK
jgi:tetratricopeptide (TPR) repeat protein